MAEINEAQRAYWLSWKERLLPDLEKHVTDHFDIYCYPGLYASKQMGEIMEARENAYIKISGVLAIDFDTRITLLLFDDAQTKYHETGHTGNGWAYETTMIEIYNESVKVSPFHELTHVLTDNTLGLPPAMFQEGLAVYICELFENRINRPSINSRVHQLFKENQLFSFSELLKLETIGSSVSRPKISYAQSGSVIKYMFESLGKDKFILLYSLLHNGSSDIVCDGNVALIYEFFNKSIEELEQDWLMQLTYQ